MGQDIRIGLYIFAGTFVYAFGGLAFLNNAPKLTPKPHHPTFFGLAALAACCVPGLVALLAGLALNKFRKWNRDVGIVLVSGVGMTVFMEIFWTWMALSPDYRRFVPRQLLPFPNYLSGISYVAVLAATGIALIIAPRGRLRQTGRSAPRSGGRETRGGDVHPS